MDVYLIPPAGGAVKRLTIHSADDTVLDWTPDGKDVFFASQRGEDFMGKLYVVSIDGGLPRDAGPDMGVAGSFSPDGTKLAVNRKAQAYWRKYYRGAYQSDVTVMDLAAQDVQGRDQLRRDGLLAALEPRRLHLLRQRPRRQGPDQYLARARDRRAGRAGDAIHQRRRPVPGDQRRRQDHRLRARFRHLEARPRQPGRSSRSRSRSPPKPRRR